MSYISVFLSWSFLVDGCPCGPGTPGTKRLHREDAAARGSHGGGGQKDAGPAVLLGGPAAETSSIQMCREAVNAEHRDEVASLSGPAAAVDEYEDAPHGGTTVREPDARGRDVPSSVRHARRLVRDERLAT